MNHFCWPHGKVNAIYHSSSAPAGLPNDLVTTIRRQQEMRWLPQFWGRMGRVKCDMLYFFCVRGNQHNPVLCILTDTNEGKEKKAIGKTCPCSLCIHGEEYSSIAMWFVCCVNYDVWSVLAQSSHLSSQHSGSKPQRANELLHCTLGHLICTVLRFLLKRADWL